MNNQEIIKVLKDAYATNRRVEMTQCGQTKIFEVEELPSLWVKVSEDENPYPLASVRILEEPKEPMEKVELITLLSREEYLDLLLKREEEFLCEFMHIVDDAMRDNGMLTHTGWIANTQLILHELEKTNLNWDLVQSSESMFTLTISLFDINHERIPMWEKPRDIFK